MVAAEGGGQGHGLKTLSPQGRVGPACELYGRPHFGYGRASGFFDFRIFRFLESRWWIEQNYGNCVAPITISHLVHFEEAIRGGHEHVDGTQGGYNREFAFATGFEFLPTLGVNPLGRFCPKSKLERFIGWPR